MKIHYAIKGKLVAEVVNATQIPRQGDLVWLTLGDMGEELYHVLRVAWSTEVVKASPPQHTEAHVIILIEPTGDAK